MEYGEALQRVTELRGRIKDGDALFDYADEINELSLAVLGKYVRKCKCRDRYKDAVIEMYTQLKKTRTMRTDVKCRMRRGVLLHYGTMYYTQLNITDEIAREAIAANPKVAQLFEVLPPPAADEPAAAETEVDETTAEDTAEDGDGDAEAERPRKVKKRKKARR